MRCGGAVVGDGEFVEDSEEEMKSGLLGGKNGFSAFRAIPIFPRLLRSLLLE